MSTQLGTSVRRVAPGALGAFPDLFIDYCQDFEAVEEFYGGDWRSEAAREAAADVAAGRPVDREVLANVLLDQNEEWGLDQKTRRNIEQLRAPDTVAVVTGQQVGLFTGPLYTIYKTITTLQLAERMAEQTGRDVVPVFWVEGEDHDVEEVRTARVFHRNEVVSLEYSVPDRPEGVEYGPAGRLSLGQQAIDRVIGRLDEVLPPSDFKPTVMSSVRNAYRTGRSLEDAFAHLLKNLFDGQGLVCMNPDDARLKALVRPLFQRELNDSRTPAARIEATSQALRDRGYHAQVRARPTNLFWLGEDGRRAIDQGEDGTFVLRGTDQVVSYDELSDSLEREPERFSPNVVLRPLMQDRLLPTTAYVAGPGEVSYFAQYGGVYDWADMEMPIIHPRASVTLVEGKVQKVLDKYELSVRDFGADLNALFQDVVVDVMEVDVDDIFQDAMTQVHKAINRVKPEAETVDRSLVSAVEATRAALSDEMNALKQKVVRAEKRQHDEIEAQLRKAQVNLRPGGELQERTINVLYYLNKYSSSLLDALRETLDLDTSQHQVVEI